MGGGEICLYAKNNKALNLIGTRLDKSVLKNAILGKTCSAGRGARREKSGEQAEQKGQKEAQELLKVHGCGAEERVERVAETSFQAVALQPVIAF